MIEDDGAVLDGTAIGEGGFAEAVAQLAAHASQFGRAVIVRCEDTTSDGEPTWFAVDASGTLTAAVQPQPQPEDSSLATELPAVHPAPLVDDSISDLTGAALTAPAPEMPAMKRRERIKTIWLSVLLSVAYVVEAVAIYLALAATFTLAGIADGSSASAGIGVL